MSRNSDNLPLLYRNALDALPNELAREVWLWAVERPGMDAMCYQADAFTREVLSMIECLGPMLEAGARVHKLDRVDPDLWSFLLKRHANWRMGGNLSPSYASGL